jgi:hypothetical protein
MRTLPQVLNRAAASGVVLLASLVCTNAAGAQATDPRWQPWLGCWVPGESSKLGLTADDNRAGGLVCVVPAANGAGVELATVANGVVVHRERVNPTGARTPKTVDNCPGGESATWSADNRRLLIRSELVCGNNVTVRGSGVFAMSPEGEWILVQGRRVGASATARVVRYQAAGLELASTAGAQVGDSTPAHIVAVTPGLSTLSLRSAAGDAVRPEDVLEVVRTVDGPVAEAWLNEIGQQFSLSAGELVRLADAGMPPAMIDLMVALSYPQRFAVKRTEPARSDPGNRGTAYDFGGGYGRLSAYDRRWDCGYGGRMLSYGYYGDSCYLGSYGLSGYGYGYGAGYGYGYGYGGYNNGYYYGTRPIVIIQREPDSPPARGRAVFGSGYTRGTGSSGTSASDRTSVTPSSGGSSAGSSSSSAGSSSSSSGSASSGSSGGGDRTAKPRVPPE